MSGIVKAIYIAAEKGEPTLSVDQVHIVPGLGIEGDRYYQLLSNPDKPPKSGRELTLIELEAIEYMRDIEGVQITPEKTRRNIITSGIALNDLVGCEFQIGNVQLRGVRLCEPCQYLADLTDKRILQAMVHRGGLRVEIITEGIISINDIITKMSKENL
jgi:MOSC domain-containing protein YiiM